MIIDYTQQFVDCLAAHGKDKNVLILYQLDVPRKRLDGKLGGFFLEHRWLSKPCEKPDDQAWACVQGSDHIILMKKEIKDVLKALKNGTLNLFEHFDLF